MSKNRVIASLDVGSSKIRVVIGYLEDGQNKPTIVGVGMSPASGIRKSMIIDVEETIRSITSALEDAERMAGEPVHHVFLGMGGHHIESTNSKGVIAISHPSGEITEDDIDRSLEAAQALSIPNNRRILRIIPKMFSVDEQKGIKYPVGMTGIRLEVDAHIVTGMTPAIKNLEKCVFQAGVDINDIVPNNLAAPESILNKRQKELGVVVVDIGCGSTNVAVYEDGTILHSAVIPLGGENVTNDVAIGLKTSLETAEKIKIEYGTCLPEDIHEKEQIDLSLLSNIDLQHVSRKTLAQIIQARYYEIFSLVKDELVKINRDGMLPAGVIITGSSSKIPGCVDLSRETLKLPVQIGFPQNFESVIEKVDDPGFSTAVGLLVWGSKFQGSDMGINFNISNLQIGKSLESVKNWFKNLIP